MSRNTNARNKHFPDNKSPNIVPDKAFLQNKGQLEENCRYNNNSSEL